MKTVLVHGSGHRAKSWKETISYMSDTKDILCPDLPALLEGREANYMNLYDAFVKYCGRVDGQIRLCGLSLGGVLAFHYALDFPEKVNRLVLIGTPCKIPKTAFAIQNVVFRCLPESAFRNMAFDKKNTFALVNSMKNLDLSSRVQKIQCPVLIICGDKDRANKKDAYYLSEHIKMAELKIMENTGHIVNEENPEELAEIVDEFMQKESKDCQLECSW